MLLSDFIEQSRIVLDIPDTGKEEIIRTLVKKIASGNKKLNEQQAVKAVYERENLGSTGIGEGIAIPHAKFDFIEDPLVAIGVSKDGVNFEAIDNLPVHIVILILGPSDEDHHDKYLELMKHTTRLLKQDVLRQKIADVPKTADVKDIIRTYET